VLHVQARLFAGYQGAASSDDELLEQLELFPSSPFVRLRRCQGEGYEADDFLAARSPRREEQGHCVVVTSDRDSFQLASERTTISNRPAA